MTDLTTQDIDLSDTTVLVKAQKVRFRKSQAARKRRTSTKHVCKIRAKGELTKARKIVKNWSKNPRRISRPQRELLQKYTNLLR